MSKLLCHKATYVILYAKIVNYQEIKFDVVRTNHVPLKYFDTSCDKNILSFVFLNTIKAF